MHQLSVRKIGWMVALACMMLGVSSTRLSAQTVQPTFTLNLSDVMELTIHTSGVNLNFTSAANYINGVTSVITNQLTVTSSNGYGLMVRASSANMTSGANTIPVSNVAVQTSGLTVGTPRVVSALSTTDQPLAQAMPSTSGQSFTLQYSTAANNPAFIKPAGAYTTTLTFTLVTN